MDYRQKMVVATVPCNNFKNEDDDDDDDLEALRLAALQSLRTKENVQNKKIKLQTQPVISQITQVSRPSFKNQRLPRRNYYPNRQRQNGNVYYQSPRNPNLIAIVPVEEQPIILQSESDKSLKLSGTEQSTHKCLIESKFHRFSDNGSCSDEENAKDFDRNLSTTIQPVSQEREDTADIEENKLDIKSDTEEPQKEELKIDDDDDVLLMADLEEEDSLERLMDEMEKEMNGEKSHKKERRSLKKENKKTNTTQKVKENSKKKQENIVTCTKNDKLASPRCNRQSQKHRSLSPRIKTRKNSPRSPKRSPVRQLKRFKETLRYRSPLRRSPSRYSPRPRSPISPRTRSPRISPRRSPIRSPMRKLSPRTKSSRSPPYIRSPLRRSRSRSRSPRLLRSPKTSPCPRSPRERRSRSPRSVRTGSMSPRRGSPVRRPISPRSRSPLGFHFRKNSPYSRSPKLSPRRAISRTRSPRSPRSPYKSPWSSPRNSPRRKRSPKWSPKETSKKLEYRQISPDDEINYTYAKDISPTTKLRTVSSDISRKLKKDEGIHKNSYEPKQVLDVSTDSVLEARRRKFECTQPINPITANKKIKLSKKISLSKPLDNVDDSTGKFDELDEREDVIEDLCLEASYILDDTGVKLEQEFPTVQSSIIPSSDVDIPKLEVEKLKKKKKRDKEIYQVGKLKNELPLSERIGKDKKYNKGKETKIETCNDNVDTIFEDLTVDEEGDLRTELSRRRAERLNRVVPIQSARLVQSAFKGVVNEVVKSKTKVNQRHIAKIDDKTNQKGSRRVTVLHRTLSETHDSEEESSVDSKIPVRFRLGLNKQTHDEREPKASRKSSKRQSRKVKNKICLSLTNSERIL